MFKRFQPPKAPAPFPPIEEDIQCPQCGFNHVGWAFEPGYAKLCVKCGTTMEASEEPDRSGEKNMEGTGFFGRIFNGMFGKKTEEPAQGEAGEEPEAMRQHPESWGESSVEQQGFLEATEADTQQTGQTETAVEAEPETGDGPGQVEPYDETQDPEAAHVGACKKEGRLLAAQGRYEEAIAMLEQVVAFEPNDIEAWGELGRIHYKGTRHLPRSIECSRKALEIDEDLVEVKSNLCLALLFDGQFDLAKKGFLELIGSVRSSRGYSEEFQESCKALLQDCLGELYVAKKEASGELLDRIKGIIELLEIEKIYFH